MRPLDKRKPAAGAAGFLNIDVLAGKIEHQEHSTNHYFRQAVRLQRRFGLSLPLARVVAELHYGRAQR